MLALAEVAGTVITLLTLAVATLWLWTTCELSAQDCHDCELPTAALLEADAAAVGTEAAADEAALVAVAEPADDAALPPAVMVMATYEMSVEARVSVVTVDVEPDGVTEPVSVAI